jgi:hypothetical protein
MRVPGRLVDPPDGSTIMLIELIGALGAVLLLSSYFGQTTGRIGLASLAGPILNLLGSVFLGLNAWVHGAYPPMVLNTLWAVIACLALIRQLRGRRARVDLAGR